LEIASRAPSKHPSRRNRYLLSVIDPLNNNPLEIANLYQQEPTVIYAAPNFQSLTPSLLSTNPDDTYFSSQWQLSQTSDKDINAPEAWDIETGGSSVIIAVIDSGVDLDHEDLLMWENSAEVDGIAGEDDDCNGFIDDRYGWNFLAAQIMTDDNGCSDPAESVAFLRDPDDGFYHGTPIAGICGAKTNNNQGVAGVVWGAQIMVLEIANSETRVPAPPWEIANAIDYAVEHGAHILQNAFWMNSYPAVTTAINNAKNGRANKGSVVVFASGNDGSSTSVDYPAKLEAVIAVGATDKSDVRFPKSNGGTQLDVVAPSAWATPAEVKLYSTDIEGAGGYNNGSPAEPDSDGNYTYGFGGTSGAAPFVSGLAGLLIAWDSELTAHQIQAIIQFSARELGDSNRDNLYGYGRIDARAALDLAAASRLQINGTDGLHKASFDNDGNVILEGDLYESGDTGHSLVELSTDLMVLRNDSSTIVARITANGDLHIKKGFCERQSSLTAPAGSPFVYVDDSGTVVAYIADDGEMQVKGKVFIGEDPDRSENLSCP